MTITADMLLSTLTDLRTTHAPDAAVEYVQASLLLTLVCGYASKARQGAAKKWYQSSVRQIRVKYSGRCLLTGEWVNPAPGGTYARWIPARKGIVSEGAWKRATNGQIRRLVRNDHT